MTQRKWVHLRSGYETDGHSLRVDRTRVFSLRLPAHSISHRLHCGDRSRSLRSGDCSVSVFQTYIRLTTYRQRTAPFYSANANPPPSVCLLPAPTAASFRGVRDEESLMSVHTSRRSTIPAGPGGPFFRAFAKGWVLSQPQRGTAGKTTPANRDIGVPISSAQPSGIYCHEIIGYDVENDSPLTS